MRTKKISELPVCPDEEIDNLKTIGVNAQNESYQVPMNKIKGSTGGLSDDIYTAIKDNVDTLWTKLNTLIGDLANLAFIGTKTSQLTNNDKTPWPEKESSDQTPTLTKPANNGGTILVGTASGGLITTSVEIKGIHLTQQLVISVSGTGFSVSPTPISAADANAGTTITVTYNSTSLNSATGSLLISSSEVSRTANLLVLAGGGTTQTFSVTQNLTGCTSSYSANMVTEGTTLTIVLTPDNGRTFTGGTISATMNNIAVAVTDGPNGTKVISFGAVTGEIEITAVAVEEQSAGNTVNVVYKLLNFNQPSGTTQDTVFGYYKESVAKNAAFVKELTTGYTSNGDLTVKSGGATLFKQGETNSNGITFNNGELSIPSTVLAGLTDDLIIEATACKGTVTITANAAANGGVTINGSAEDLASGSNTFSISTISSLSFASGAKAKITSIDFGGAQFTGTTLASMFSGFTALTQVKGLVVTGSVTSLASMFSGCSALTVFDTIGWDTSAVTTIEALAYNCTALTKVDLGSKDMGSLTSAGTTDTTGAFGKCSNLANFDVSHWNAPNLTSLRAFLYQCTSLTKFDASTWDAPKVANMWGMFATCSALTEIDISGIDTTYANAQGTLSVGHLFHLSQASARNLSKLTIGKFDTSKVATLESFFWYACGEKELELHCKSAVVPSISSDTSKIWFRAGNTSASHNGKQMVGSVYVPTGYMEDYKTAWSSYLSSDTTWHEE